MNTVASIIASLWKYSSGLAAPVAIIIFLSKEYWFDPKNRAEEKRFKQIKENYRRAFELLEGSNSRSNWVAARGLIGRAIELSDQLKNTGFKAAYKLEEQYYRAKFNSLLNDVSTYKYFFGIAEHDYEKMSDVELFKRSNGSVMEVRRDGESRSVQERYVYIDPLVIFFIIRFVLMGNEKFLGRPHSGDISREEEGYFDLFPVVMKYVDALKELLKDKHNPKYTAYLESEEVA